jgi:hypothetical protein
MRLPSHIFPLGAFGGADPGFQVRGAHLKNCAERREARKCLRYLCEKSRFYAKKIIFFSNIRGGGGAGCPPPPLDPPLVCTGQMFTFGGFARSYFPFRCVWTGKMFPWGAFARSNLPFTCVYPFSFQSCRTCYARLYLCQRPFKERIDLKWVIYFHLYWYLQ